MAPYNVFISSPGDVMPERKRVELVLRRLNQEVMDSPRFVPILWEDNYYLATGDFQGQISNPADADLVICILWKRLGTELPPDRYHRSDGSSYASGTEYEFEMAHARALASGSPDILVYRKTAKVFFEAGDKLAIEQAQHQALDGFWRKWFHSENAHYRAAFHTFETVDLFERQLEVHLRSWMRQHEQVAWPASKGSPFRGLEAFDEAHAPVFFGRARAIEQVRARMIAADLRRCAFLLLLGASGSGKSSLVRAGVLPRVLQPGAIPQVDLWTHLILQPAELGSDLILGFCNGLYSTAGLDLNAGDYQRPEDLAQLIRQAPSAVVSPLRAALLRRAAAERDQGGYDRDLSIRLLIVIDQFEELFHCPAADRNLLLRLTAALACSGVAWIIVTMRSDFYPMFQSEPVLMELKESGGQYDVVPPGPAEIREIIHGPSAAAGLSFETWPETGDGIDEELERAASDPGSLPLLQFTLEELYKQRAPGSNRLTASAYEAIGGLNGAIQRVADGVFNNLSEEEQDALPSVLEALVDVAPAGGSRPTARTALRQSVAVGEATRRIVDVFVAKRLLVAGRSQNGPTLRVAHEALISHWPRATNVLAANRDFYRVRARIENAETEWREQNCAERYLLPHGRPLAEAAEALNQRRPGLSQDIIAFIEQSMAADDSRQAMKREWEITIERERVMATQITIRRTLAFAIVGIIIFLGLLIVEFLYIRTLQRDNPTVEQSIHSNLNMLERPRT